VKSMYEMFKQASSFNQNISLWNVSYVNTCFYFSFQTPQWTLPKPNFTDCYP